MSLLQGKRQCTTVSNKVNRINGLWTFEIHPGTLRISAHHESCTYNALTGELMGWKKAKKGIQNDLGKATYQSWIIDLYPISDDGETLVLRHTTKRFAPQFIMSTKMTVMNVLQYRTRRRIKIIGPCDKFELEEP